MEPPLDAIMQAGLKDYQPLGLIKSSHQDDVSKAFGHFLAIASDQSLHRQVSVCELPTEEQRRLALLHKKVMKGDELLRGHTETALDIVDVLHFLSRGVATLKTLDAVAEIALFWSPLSVAVTAHELKETVSKSRSGVQIFAGHGGGQIHRYGQCACAPFGALHGDPIFGNAKQLNAVIPCFEIANWISSRLMTTARDEIISASNPISGLLTLGRNGSRSIYKTLKGTHGRTRTLAAMAVWGAARQSNQERATYGAVFDPTDGESEEQQHGVWEAMKAYGLKAGDPYFRHSPGVHTSWTQVRASGCPIARAIIHILLGNKNTDNRPEDWVRTYVTIAALDGWVEVSKLLAT